MSLFATPSAGSSRSTSNSGNLVEFRAGRMNMNGTTVTANPRKGLFYIKVSPEDHLLHVCWKDRISGKVEEDLILFPEDAELKRVPQCTTGRVFLLKFTTDDRKMFFWMQEPKADKDEEYLVLVNKILASSNPSSLSLASSTNTSANSGSAAASLLSAAAGGSRDASNLLAALQGFDRGRLSNFLENISNEPASASSEESPSASSSVANEPEASPATSSQPSEESRIAQLDTSSAPAAPRELSLRDLQNMISSAQQEQQADRVNLSNVLNPEAFNILLSQNDVVQQLLQHLPPGVAQTTEELRSLVHSPQFSQAVQAFNAALLSGNLNSILSQFGIDPADASSAHGVEAFLQAIQRSQDRNNTGNNSGSNSNNGDGGDAMEQ